MKDKDGTGNCNFDAIQESINRLPNRKENLDPINLRMRVIRYMKRLLKRKEKWFIHAYKILIDEETRARFADVQLEAEIENYIICVENPNEFTGILEQILVAKMFHVDIEIYTQHTPDEFQTSISKILEEYQIPCDIQASTTIHIAYVNALNPLCTDHFKLNHFIALTPQHNYRGFMKAKKPTLTFTEFLSALQTRSKKRCRTQKPTTLFRKDLKSKLISGSIIFQRMQAVLRSLKRTYSMLHDSIDDVDSSLLDRNSIALNRPKRRCTERSIQASKLLNQPLDNTLEDKDFSFGYLWNDFQQRMMPIEDDPYILAEMKDFRETFDNFKARYCTICQEMWFSDREYSETVCYRCVRDETETKRFSAENNMCPLTFQMNLQI